MAFVPLHLDDDDGDCGSDDTDYGDDDDGTGGGSSHRSHGCNYTIPISNYYCG